MNTLVYVDRKLALGMAVRLVGLELHDERTRSTGGSFNWLVQAHISQDETSGVTTDIRELLPEEVMYELHTHIDPKRKFSNVASCVEAMARNGEDRLLPGSTLSVCGTLCFPAVKEREYDPFDPPDIECRKFQFYGETCFAGELNGDGFRLPIYFEDAARAQVVFCHDNPVEITGIVRWSPPYSPKGARSLGLVIRAAAVWLR